MRRRTPLAALALVAALAGAAHAQTSQPVISPQSIIVNPVQTNLTVSVGVDKPGDNPAYAIGEGIRVSVGVDKDAYVYLFSIHSDGEIDLILPNRYSGGDNLLRAGERRYYPPAGAAYKLTIAGPAGQDKVLAVAALRPLNIDEIARFEGKGQFATVNVRGGENLARALSIVVEKVPPADWVTDVAYFRVGNGAGTTPPPGGNPGGTTGGTTGSNSGGNQGGNQGGTAPSPANGDPGRLVRGYDTIRDGATVSGTLNPGPTLLLQPGVNPQFVQFYLRDANGKQVFFHSEGQAPYCVNGDAVKGTCNPWGLGGLANGDYRLSAYLHFTSGATVTYTIGLRVENPAGGTSGGSNLDPARYVRGYDTLRDGDTIRGKLPRGATLLLQNGVTNIKFVQFVLLDAQGRTVFSHNEGAAPYCLNGDSDKNGKNKGRCDPVDFSKLGTGDYSLLAILNLTSGQQVRYAIRLHLRR